MNSEKDARFQVLKAPSMKAAVFWVVAPCSLVDVYRRFRGACSLLQQGDRADDAGSTYLGNVGKRLPDNTSQQPRRQPSSVKKML
jgi:hypothetical protein